MNILKNISDISGNHYHYLFTHENVKGVGVGYKFINGMATNELCIHVLVERKVNRRCLTYNNIVPKTYMGIKTDIIEIGTPRSVIGSNNKYLERYRPLKAGCGIYSKDATFHGTLTCIVFRKKLLGNKYFILSNNHVLADGNRISIETKVIQPSIKDGGNFETDVVAKLSEFKPLKFATVVTKPKNFVDCAIAEVNKKSLISKEILTLGKIYGISKAVLNQNVRKVGFVSGLTSGKVISLNVTTEINYIGNKKAFFADQIFISASSIPGDSGSIVVDHDNKVLGMLFAAGAQGTSFVNDINVVLKELNVELYH